MLTGTPDVELYFEVQKKPKQKSTTVKQ